MTVPKGTGTSDLLFEHFRKIWNTCDSADSEELRAGRTHAAADRLY